MASPESDGSLVTCPACGTRRAKKTFWKFKCTNPNCKKYDADYAEQARQNRITGKSATSVFPHLKGDFSPRTPVTVRYENFRGDELTYLADSHGAYRTGEHVVMHVAPAGSKIAFRLSAIKNRAQVEGDLSPIAVPSGNERRVLHFHLRRGSSSALFVKIRQKYPDYEP
jgi:hypothetical protein